jgi:hypothetical protein
MAHQFHRGLPKGPFISDEEIFALREVANHKVTNPSKCRRLKNLGLIEQELGFWSLTQQGRIRLMFIDAR